MGRLPPRLFFYTINSFYFYTKCMKIGAFDISKYDINITTIDNNNIPLINNKVTIERLYKLFELVTAM